MISAWASTTIRLRPPGLPESTGGDGRGSELRQRHGRSDRRIPVFSRVERVLAIDDGMDRLVPAMLWRCAAVPNPSPAPSPSSIEFSGSA